MIFFLTYLHDDRTIILFHTNNSTVKSEVIWFIKNYKFKIKDEWTFINYLHLPNPLNLSENINSNYGLSSDCFIFEFVFIWCVIFKFNFILNSRLWSLRLWSSNFILMYIFVRHPNMLHMFSTWFCLHVISN